MSVSVAENVVAMAIGGIHSARQADPWRHTRRANQVPPEGDWRNWLIMAGRGFGKTRTGAEWIRDYVQTHPGCRVALVGPTAADVRDVMVEGESGVVAVCERYRFAATYKSSKRRIDFGNGSFGFLYSADEPNRLRGPQHHIAWADEIGAWRYGPDAWDNLQFGLRLGDNPQVIATSTPRVVSLVRQLAKQASEEGADTVITRGSTYDNKANLAPSFLTAIEARYAGTRLGRQEIEGELLEDVEGALWTIRQIDACRTRAADVDIGALTRIVVAVDPPATADGAECGIVVCGVDADRRGYVLADTSRRGTPAQWAQTVIETFDEWNANEVVIEVNQGGDMAVDTLHTRRASLPVKRVHASRGKLTRAEPVSALYEQHRVSHVGTFSVLEDQMANWVPGETSPDRMDAMVWGLTALLIGAVPPKVAAVAMPQTSTWGR